jgi:hypothetical protein
MIRQKEKKKMPERTRQPHRILLFVFIILNAVLIATKKMLHEWGVDANVVIVGHLVLFGITLLSYFLAMRGLRSPNPHAFMRSIYSSIIVKLFLCMIAAFVYIAIKKSGLNKPALFTLMGLYLVYTFLEVSALTKQLRLKTNG